MSASLKFYPEGYKAGKAYLQAPNTDLTDFNVNRNSKARAIDATGADIELAENVPVYDYRGDYVAPIDGSYYDADDVTGKVVIPDQEFLDGTPWSVIIEGAFDASNTQGSLIGGYASTAQFAINIANKLGFYDGTSWNYFTKTFASIRNLDTEFGLSTDGTTVSLFIDGVYDSSVTPASTYFKFNQLVKGWSGDALGCFGTLKKITAYNYKLTNQEFLDRYNGLPIPEEYKGANNIELITNGDFATDTDWIKAGGATISGGVANIVGDGSSFTNIEQSGVFENGYTYLVVIDLSIISGPGLKLQDNLANENIGVATSSGVYFFTFEATTSSLLVIGRRTGGVVFESYVNSVSVIRVGNTLSLSTGKTASTWYDLEHDIQGVVNGATLNNSTDFGSNTYPIETCPALLTQGVDITNRFQDSANPITQTINGLTVGVPQTLSCKGDGVITIVENGGSLLGGAATEVYPFTFTPTHTSVDVTLSAGHSLEHVNFTDTPYAVNHILTPNGGIATRLKDEITGGGDVNTFNSDELVLEVEMKALVSSGLESVVTVSDGTVDNRIRLGYTATLNKLTFVFVLGGVTQYSFEPVIEDVTKITSLKFKCKTNDFGVKVDGVELDSQNSGTMASAGTFNTIELANGVGNFNLSARTKYTNVYKVISNY